MSGLPTADARLAPAELAEQRDVLRSLFAGERTTLCVPGLVPPAEAAQLVRAVQELQLPPHPFSVAFEAYSYGLILDHAGADLGPYLDSARATAGLLDSNEAARGVLDTVADALASLAGGACALSTPRAPDGRSYAPQTVRRYPTGGLIPPHCEREQLDKPPFAQLRGELDPTTLLSYLLVLERPEAGGQLVIYDLGPDDPGAADVYRDRSQLARKLPGVPHEVLELEPGDLWVFDGGRRFHQILPVQGPAPRWTLGGFIGRARAGGYLRWS